MRILLVEDCENVQGYITAVLKQVDANVEVEVTENGDDALKRYLEHPHYDLVITDHVHLGMSGIELIELILERNPLQPVILQTGNSGAHIEAFEQKHRDIPLLGKPYNLRQLEHIVKMLLDKRNATTSGATDEFDQREH